MEDVTMGQKGNYFIIGAFVLTAIVLLVAALLLFGSGRLFQDKALFVIHFEDSVKGLEVGAPVLFRGVRVGNVRKVYIRVDPKRHQSHTTTEIEILPDVLNIEGSGRDLEERIPELINEGLRAQMRLDSFITGRRYVSLLFDTNTVATLHDQQSDLEEIPAIPTELDRISRALNSIDFEKVGKEFSSVMEGLDALLHTNTLNEALAKLPEILDNISAATKDLPPMLDSISIAAGNITTQLVKAVDMVAYATEDIAAFISTARVSTAELTPRAITALDQVTDAVKQLHGTLDEVDQLLRGGGPGRANLTASLRDLRASLRSLRDFLDYIDRNPEALIWGKSAE
jgi:paraquat-inducible protein B